jgi:hypothetical protein
MKRSEIKTGMTYAVVIGSMYEGAEASAQPAIVVEIGVAVDNFNHKGRASWTLRRPSSTTSDGVRIQLLDRDTLEPERAEDGFRTAVIKSRNVIDLWSSHLATMRLRAERLAAATKRSETSQAALEEWTAKLGMKSYEMPTLGGGIQGGVGWDSEYSRNRAALVRVLEQAYQLGRRDSAAS